MLGQHELAPGGRTTLKIVYNTYKFPGTFEKYVTVSVAAPDKAEHKITLKGMVDPIPMGVLDVEPRKVEAGDMAVGKPVRLEFLLKNTGDAPLRVDKVAAQKSGAVFFDASRDGALTLGPGEERRIAATVTASAPGSFIEYAMVFSDARNVTEKGYKVVIVGAAK